MLVTPRVRFAPSPSGFLHVGGARTALFNWLYARHHGGTFVLRIEDTDAERSSDESVRGILDGLRWLGLGWDEGPEVGGPHGPYFQSKRLDDHRGAAVRLLDTGNAYRCYCTPDRLKAERERAESSGGAWTYDRTCLSLSAGQAAALESAATPSVVRFKIPPGRTQFIDSVRGNVDVAHDTIEDFVILRSDGVPTFHLSVVVDDIAMHITHVIRGDDHLSNTPKHLLLYSALGAEAPQYAHVPLIFGPDKKRLSKRHGATSVAEYQHEGFLPEALMNFLSLLGWSPGDDREVMSRDELIAAFSPDGISGGNAVFDIDKLEWMNGQYIARRSPDELNVMVAPWLHAEGLWPSSDRDDAWLLQLLALLQPRVKRLQDFVDQARPFLAQTVTYEEDAVTKHLGTPGLDGHLAALITALRQVESFDEANVEDTVRDTATIRGIKAGPLIHATRVAMTGRTSSPGLFEVVVLLGRECAVERLERLHRYLDKRP